MEEEVRRGPPTAWYLFGISKYYPSISTCRGNIPKTPMYVPYILNCSTAYCQMEKILQQKRNLSFLLLLSIILSYKNDRVSQSK